MNLTRIRAGFAALALILLPSLAFAQSQPAYQSGTVRQGDLLKAYRSGQHGSVGTDLGDALTAKGVNPFAITDSNGPGLCFYPSTSNGAVNPFCLGHDVSNNPVFSVSGINYPFLGGSGSGNITGATPTTSGSLAVWSNATGSALKDGGTGILNGVSAAAFLDFANLTITDTATNTVTGTIGGPKIDGLRINHKFSGGEGNRNATFSVLEQTNSTPLHANTSFFTSNFAWTKVTSATNGGNYYAYGGLTEHYGGGTASIKGAEFDTSVQPGAVAAYNVTLTLDLVNSHASRGTFDAAMDISSDASRTATYKNGIVFGDPLGWWAFANDSTLIGTNAGIGGSPARTAQYGIDMSGVTFSVGGGFLKSTGFLVDNNGITNISPATTGSTSALIVQGGTAGGDTNGGMIAMVNTGAGATTPNKFLRVNSNGDFEMLNSAYSAVILGATNAGLLKLGAGGLAANGSVATVLGSVGPAGASTAVRKWVAVTDGANTYYLPGF